MLPTIMASTMIVKMMLPVQAKVMEESKQTVEDLSLIHI